MMYNGGEIMSFENKLRTELSNDGGSLLKAVCDHALAAVGKYPIYWTVYEITEIKTEANIFVLSVQCRRRWFFGASFKMDIIGIKSTIPPIESSAWESFYKRNLRIISRLNSNARLLNKFEVILLEKCLFAGQRKPCVGRIEISSSGYILWVYPHSCQEEVFPVAKAGRKKVLKIFNNGQGEENLVNQAQEEALPTYCRMDI